VKSIVSVLSIVRVQKSPQLKASNVRNQKSKAATETALPDFLVVGHLWRLMKISGNFRDKESENAARESLLFF
jgi:hypothetical protein